MPARTTYDTATDHELLERSSEDLAAFGELVRRHQAFVHGAAMRIVRNPVLAEDLAQEAFVRAFKAKDRFRGDAAVRTWLYRIATNLALNAVTRTRESPVLTDDHLLRATTPGPADEVIDADQRRRVREAVAGLPEHFRLPLVLCEYEGMSYEAIAERLDIPLNTVRTRIHRARAELRRITLEEGP